MAEPFLSEVRLFGFDFAPRGWSQCDGQLLAINQNQSLFSLIGTMYGGDGRTTFGLPDFRGRAPIHASGAQQGKRSGSETVTLDETQVPSHSHTVLGTIANANVNDFSSRILAAGYQFTGRAPQHGSRSMYAAPNNLNALNIQSVSAIGGNQAHNNMQPSLVVNFCIAMQGLFPSRN